MPEPLLFDRLLRQAATMLRTYYPGEDSRLGRGLELALNNAVRLGWAHGEPTAQVDSSTDREVYYTIKDTHCDCPDQSAPGGRCKHRFAVALMRMALALADMQDHQEESA